jgi:hypothetical protein
VVQVGDPPTRLTPPFTLLFILLVMNDFLGDKKKKEKINLVRVFYGSSQSTYCQHLIISEFKGKLNEDQNL